MSHSTVMLFGPVCDDGGVPRHWESVVATMLAPFDESKAVKPYRESEQIPPSHRLEEYPTEEAYIAYVRGYFARRWDDYDEWVAAGKPPVPGYPASDLGAFDSPEYKAAMAAHNKGRGVMEIEESTTQYRYLAADGSEVGQESENRVTTKAVACDAIPSRDADDMTVLRSYHGESLDRDDEGWFVMSTYNPKSRWDWYAIGGRWLGYFTLKPDYANGVLGVPTLVVRGNPFSSELARQEYEHHAPKLDGGHADAVLAGMVDWEAMRDAAGKRAAERWDLFQTAVGDTEPALSWEAVLDLYCPRSGEERDRTRLDEARSAYHQQERLTALKAFTVPNGEKEDRPFSWLEEDDLRVLQGDRDACIEYARMSAVPTFAYLRGGEWIEREKMGWWGMRSEVEGAPSYEDWCAHFNQMVDDLDPNTLLVLVDVHI